MSRARAAEAAGPALVAALVAAHGLLYGGLALGPAAAMGAAMGTEAALAALVLAAGLVAASVTDMRRHVIPDEASLGLVLAGLGATAWLRPEALGLHALAAAAWYGLLAGVSGLYLRWRGRDGLGLGDAKLMAAAAAWVGPGASAAVLLYAAGAAAATVAAGLALRGFRVPEPGRVGIAFGPFIALATWIVWLYGSALG